MTTVDRLDRRRPTGSVSDRRRPAGMPVFLFVFLLLVAGAGPAAAQEPGEADRDAAIFGSDGGGSDDGGESNRDDAIFGADDEPEPAEPTLTKEDLLALEEDILTIGGQLYLRFSYTAQQDQGIEDNRFAMPNLLDLYLDARPTDRIRAFVRGRMTYDPTLPADGSDPMLGALGGTRDNPDVLLDQLWLKFDIGRAVYVTLGKQRAKWGTGRLWNPLDFLNDSHREPLAFFDERTGVSMVKLHIPVESLGWNFYAVALLDQASSLDRLGVAGRAEFVVGTTELALSAKWRKDTAPRLGVDFSAGVWDLDIRAEVGLSFGTDAPTYEGRFALATDPTTGAFTDLVFPTAVDHDRDEVIPQVVGGVEYGIQVTDDDILYIGLEYFYNHLGYGDHELYPWLAMTGTMEFFYTGRHYGALYLLYPNPGSLESTTFQLSGIGNFSDQSFMARFDFSMTILTWLRLETYVAGHFGTRGGELRFAFDLPAFTVPEGVDLGDIPIAPGTDVPATSIPPALFDIGINLRVSI